MSAILVRDWLWLLDRSSGETLEVVADRKQKVVYQAIASIVERTRVLNISSQIFSISTSKFTLLEVTQQFDFKTCASAINLQFIHVIAVDDDQYIQAQQQAAKETILCMRDRGSESKE